MIWYRGLLLLLILSIMVIANLAPGSVHIGSANDKLNHALAFAILTPLAILAFPRSHLWTIFAALAFLGAAIEISQATLRLGREPDILDWLAGALASWIIITAVAFQRVLLMRL